jgi:hypothetical protein
LEYVDRLEAIRDLEFVNGGIHAAKRLDGKESPFSKLMEDWSTIIESVLEELVEDYEDGTRETSL